MASHPVTYKLRAWRRNAQMSQDAAAAAIGVARRTWHLWENGKTIPGPEHMAALVVLTGGAVEPNDFYRTRAAPRQDAA